MCLFGGGSVSKPEPVAPEPTRETVTAAGYESPSAIAQTRSKIAKRLGMFGNINSPKGDEGYGSNVAKFGDVSAASGKALTFGAVGA